MAKDKQEDIDLDSMDFDGGFDDEISFGEPKAKKPKTTREAVTASLTDGAKGFSDELTSDPVKTAKDLMEKSLPNSVRSEYFDIKDTYTTLKDDTTVKIEKVSQSILCWMKKNHFQGTRQVHQ